MIILDSSGVRSSSATRISYEAWRHLPEHELEILKTGSIRRVYCKSEDVQLWGDATYFYRPEAKPPAYLVKEKMSSAADSSAAFEMAVLITAAVVTITAVLAGIWVIWWASPETSAAPVTTSDHISTDVISALADANIDMLARAGVWILRIGVTILVLWSMVRLWLRGPGCD